MTKPRRQSWPPEPYDFTPAPRGQFTVAERAIEYVMVGAKPLGRRPWVQDAACRGCDPAMWFAERGEPVAEAKAVCRGCPVRSECLDDALSRREKYGTWGGLTFKERRRVARERKQAA